MSRLRSLIPILCLILLGGVLYWPGLKGGFIFDDYPNLVEDPDWKLLSLEPLQWWHAGTSGIASMFGRPLALLSFAFNYYVSGMDPRPMKLVGVSMHLFNGVLVYCLCRKLLVLIGGRLAACSVFVASLVAIAWVVHPIQVSTVLYIVQRMEVGAVTGVLLALLAYIKAREAQMSGARAVWWWLLVVLAAILGLGFKETVFLLPCYLFLLELVILRFRGRGGRTSRWLLGGYLASGGVALLVFFFLFLPGVLRSEAYEFRNFTVGERLLSQPAVLWMYLHQILIPWPETYWFYYDNFPVSRGLLKPLATLYAIAGLLLAVVVAAWCRKQWPLTTLGIGWFFLAHLLTSNVVPFELAFEHRNYFALLGVLLAIVQPLEWLLRRLDPNVAATISVLPILFLASMCWIQVGTWADPLRLAMTLASRNPGSERAGYEFGRLLIERSGHQVDSPLWSMAEQEFENASKIDGGSPLPEQALIVISSSYGRPISPEIWPRFRYKLLARGVGPQELSALGGVVDCRIEGRCKFNDENALLLILQDVVTKNQKSARARAIFASYAFNVMRDHELGISLMREAIQLDAHELEYRVGLVRYLQTSGENSEVEERDLVYRLQEVNVGGKYDAYLDEFSSR